VRLTTRLLYEDAGDIDFGMRVELVFVDAEHGVRLPVFRPLATSPV
jgi:hypothetical protein